MNNDFDIAIIGAGPSGIMAAIFAARNGKKVVLLEKNEQTGRKILATGNGRCNLTNRQVSAKNYHSGNQNFVANVLKQFDNKETIGFFESLGLILKEEARGRLFPRTNQASSVLDALQDELIQWGVEVLTGFLVKNIAKDLAWVITSENGKTVTAKKLILATGGKAAHQLGSSGDGIFWAQKLGHSISPLYAALVPVETIETWPKEVQGIKVEAEVKAIFDEKVIAEKSGDLLFTHFGVSGPVILSLAGKVSPLLERGSVRLEADIFPELDEALLDQKLADIFSANGSRALKNALIGVAPANLLPVILKHATIDFNKKAAEVSKEERRRIVENIKKIKLTVSKVRPLKEAQVTVGGVDLSEVDPKTLESKIIPDLYFAGEILDVDGESGGFNLQWAWSSGYVAGTSAAK